MNKLLKISIIAILSQTFLYGESVKQVIEETNKVHREFDKIFMNFEKNIDNKSVYTVLKKYNSRKADLVLEWFDIVRQLSYNEEVAYFIKHSSYKTKSLLFQMFLSKDNALSSEDKKFIFEKIDLLNRESSKYSVKNLNKEMITKKSNVYLRIMPIKHELTIQRDDKNKFCVIKKGSKINLLYKMNFKNKKGQPLEWGYIEDLNSSQEGWINLHKVKG